MTPVAVSDVRSAGRGSGSPLPRADWLGSLVGVGILLTSATQLRLRDLPIGPGEVVLAISLVFLAVAALRSGGGQASGLAGQWLWFWLSAFAAMMAGWVVGIVTAETLSSSGRDAVAYGFSSLRVALLVAAPRPGRTIAAALEVVLIGTPLAIGALAVLAVMGQSTGPINVWYEGVRFRAWAANPNQLALLLAPQPWLALGLRRRGRHRRLLAMSAVVVIPLGIATGSDALAAAWILGAIAWAVVSGVRFIVRSRGSVRSAGLAYVVFPLALTFTAVAIGEDVLAWVGRRTSTTYLRADQGPDRLARWWFGLEAVAQSPVVGFGPGSFSGNRAAFSGEEAHSTPIDWATSTGMLGLAAFGLLVGWIGYRVVRRGDVWDAAALIVLLAFMALHYMLRQPAAWFYLVVLSASGVHASRPRKGLP